MYVYACKQSKRECTHSEIAVRISSCVVITNGPCQAMRCLSILPANNCLSCPVYEYFRYFTRVQSPSLSLSVCLSVCLSLTRKHRQAVSHCSHISSLHFQEPTSSYPLTQLRTIIFKPSWAA